MRRVVELGLAAVVMLVPATAVTGQALGSVIFPTGTIRPCYPSHGAHRVFVQGDRLRNAYDLLLERSPSFAAAMAGIEESGSMRIRIGHRRHLMPASERVLGEERSAAGFMSEGRNHHPAGTILCEVRVIVFTEALEEQLVEAGVPEEEVVLDLALILAHEVYGHLVPFAEQSAPAWPTPCRDPDRGQAGEDSGCAVERENVIRRELGMPERLTYAQVEGPLLCALPGQQCPLPEPRTARWRLAGPIGEEVGLPGSMGRRTVWRAPARPRPDLLLRRDGGTTLPAIPRRP